MRRRRPRCFLAFFLYVTRYVLFPLTQGTTSRSPDWWWVGHFSLYITVIKAASAAAEGYVPVGDRRVKREWRA
jgi:hypothetical protein